MPYSNYLQYSKLFKSCKQALKAELRKIFLLIDFYENNFS